MDMELIKEWLVQHGIPKEELENIQPDPIVEEINNLNHDKDRLQEENLTIMEVTATLYETNLQLEMENTKLKEDNLATMEALAEIYEATLL